MRLQRNKGDTQTFLLIFLLLAGFLLVGNYLSSYITTDVTDDNSDMDTATTTKDVLFTTLEQGSMGGLADRGALVIKNSSEWSNLKVELSSGILDSKNVSFDQSTVIAAFMGEKNTGGYTIRVEKIQRINNQITVNIRETAPGIGCVVSESTTRAYHIVTIPKTSESIKFVSIDETNNCN